MKKTFIVILILIISAVTAFVYTGLDEKIIKKNHPTLFSEYVDKYCQQYSVPKDLVYAVIKTESSFKSDAVSHKGAIGLMQITPDTYEWLCTKEPTEQVNADLLYTPQINIHYGTMFLSMLYSEYGVWETALAAYNAGRATVMRWLSDEKYSKDGRLTDIPYKETREYVEKVLKTRDIYTEILSQN